MKLLSFLENLVRRLPLSFKAEKRSGFQAGNSLAENCNRVVPGEITADPLEKLITEAASPLSQLVLQDHIVQKPNNSLTASDVLVNVRRLMAVFDTYGISPIGQTGETTIFNSTFHESMMDDFNPRKGQLVRIQFPGIAYKSTIVRKAAVVSPEADQ